MRQWLLGFLHRKLVLSLRAMNHVMMCTVHNDNVIMCSARTWGHERIFLADKRCHWFRRCLTALRYYKWLIGLPRRSGGESEWGISDQWESMSVHEDRLPNIFLWLWLVQNEVLHEILTVTTLPCWNGWLLKDSFTYGREFYMTLQRWRKRRRRVRMTSEKETSTPTNNIDNAEDVKCCSTPSEVRKEAKATMLKTWNATIPPSKWEWRRRRRRYTHEGILSCIPSCAELQDMEAVATEVH